MKPHFLKFAVVALLIVCTVLAYQLLNVQKSIVCTVEAQSSNKDALIAQRFKITEGFQTSARYLSKLAKLDACIDPTNEQKLIVHTMIKDLEIKATSYAFLNKVFFWISLVFAIGIIVFPIVHTLTPTEGHISKIFNPTQLPAIILLAGLCFTFYTDYKSKQTSAENLIRYVYFSEESTVVKSRIVREALSEIDGGQDFSKLISQ